MCVTIFSLNGKGPFRNVTGSINHSPTDKSSAVKAVKYLEGDFKN